MKKIAVDIGRDVKDMKYNNLQHELDQEATIWSKLENQYYLWGAAGKGTTFIRRYHNKLSIKAVADRDSNKQGKKLLGVPIISPEELNMPDACLLYTSPSPRDA